MAASVRRAGPGHRVRWSGDHPAVHIHLHQPRRKDSRLRPNTGHPRKQHSQCENIAKLKMTVS